MSNKVLVFGDDERMTEQICFALRDPGLDPVGVCKAPEALRTFYAHRPSLVVLDLDGAEYDGWELCGKIRELVETPIIVISSDSDRDTLLKGYAVGVDGFVTKPFTTDVLVQHVTRVMRRRAGSEAFDFPPAFESNGISIDWSQHEVRVDGEKVSLTATEYKLLKCLAEHPNRVVSHEQILTKVWGAEYLGDRSYVKLYVRYLREKLESDPSNPRRILTERGFGYRLAA